MTHKILIVDDEPNIVISLEFLMKKEGFEIAIATDGEEALAKVASFGPDLMLLDVMMPKKSGFEVCEALRADPANANLQIVMLTASANVLIQRLIERKLDLIITNDVSTEPSHVFRKLLFHEPSVLILPKPFEKDPDQNWTWQRLAVCGLPLIRCRAPRWRRECGGARRRPGATRR